ncbi:MAG: LPS assembly lipoprotein LptE [Pseudomonadota bacterium]
MSWSDRRTLLSGLAAALALQGCGFTPLYGPNSPATRLQNSIAIAPLEGRFGFEMRQQLEARLGPADAPRYLLDITPQLTSVGSAIRSDNTITRVNVTGRAAVVLTDFNGEAPLFTANLRNFTAYSTTASAFATDIARQDAERRLAIALADQIVLRLATTAGDWAT